jgi:bla regulator protein blaR1
MASTVLGALASATVASSCGILLTLLLRKQFRMLFGPSLAYYLWLLVPTSLLVLLLPTPRPGMTAVLAVPLSVPSLTSHVLTSRLVEVAISSTSNWTMWTLCSWGIGALLFARRLTRQQRRFVDSLGVTIKGANRVLRAADPTGGPVVVGILRPKIVVPSDFDTRYTKQEQALILAHEQMHVRRRDLLVNATWSLARCIFWFNPLTHLAGRLMRFDQELACDAQVMRNHPRSRKPYASAMLRTQLVDDPLPLGCHWPSIHPLKVRIMVLKRPPAGGVRRVIGQMIVGLCVLTVGYGTWAAQSAVGPAAHTATAADHPQLLNGAADGDASRKRNPGGGPVMFDADYSDCSVDGKSCTYSGHVRFSVKEFVILADGAKASRTDSGFVLVAHGTPATLTHTPSSGAAVVRGAAKRIVLDGAAGAVELTGDASLTQGGGTTVTGERLIYKVT